MSFYDGMRTLAQQGDLLGGLRRTMEYYATIPRWRIIRRLHVERQIMFLELAAYCYEMGIYAAARKK